MRQIKLYREYLQMKRAPVGVLQSVLVSRYELKELDLETLAQEGVSHLGLGPNFDRFVLENKNRIVKSDLI